MEVKGGKDETDASGGGGGGGGGGGDGAADGWVGAFQFGRSPERPYYKPDGGKRKRIQKRIGRRVEE